jgi:ABC-type branched-subunit amino acid transport system substrate-binding protein
MRSTKLAAVGAACAALLVMTACANNDSPTAASGGRSRTLDIGVLTSLSGPQGAAAATTLDGVNARFKAYAADSGKCASSVKFNVVTADDQSTPQGALAGLQKLVQQDHVYTVIAETGLFFGASHWAVTQGAQTPIIGGAFDGSPEWKDYPDNNLFPNFPVVDFKKVYTTLGDYFASVGATKVAGVAYNSPSSAGALENGFQSSEKAGLERGYANTSVPFGSTDVSAIVLGIKNSGADAVYMTMSPPTAFAVIAGLRQLNYPLKAIVTASGYGGDLLQSQPAIDAGQGVSFSTSWTPIEANTDATTYLSKSMKKYGNTPSGVPGFYATVGWFGADLLIHGLELAGCDASSKTFLDTVRSNHTWDAGGMYPKPIPFDANNYDASCTYFVKLQGNAFVPIEGSTPRCGKPVNG